jgi:uncharacterized integral membrane protein
MKLSWFFIIFLLVFVAVFSVQNADVITVHFLKWEIQISAALVIQLAAILGALVGLACGAWSRRASRPAEKPVEPPAEKTPEKTAPALTSASDEIPAPVEEPPAPNIDSRGEKKPDAL